MSMSTHVIGFKPPDQRWKEMKSVWDACEKANAGIPGEVIDFFNGEEPDESGVEVELQTYEWNGDMTEGVEIKVYEIPKDVKTNSFYNSW